jgi:hypothetical protein
MGWLVFTHGVGPMREYAIGAALLDLNEPERLIAALSEPLLVADESERVGYVPNVVYSCGAMVYGDHVVLPYGCSDSSVRIAMVDLLGPVPARRPAAGDDLPGERRRLRRDRPRPPARGVAGSLSSIHTALILNEMPRMKDLGCDNQNVSPTPAQRARATRIARELAALARTGFALPGTVADRMTRCGYPGCRCHAAPPPRPLPPVDPQERRQDRHPDPDRRPARRLPALVRQPPPPPRADHRTRSPQPGHRRSRPPLEPQGCQVGNQTGQTRS